VICIVRGIPGSGPKKIVADEESLQRLADMARIMSVDIQIEVFDPHPHSLAHRSIVSHPIVIEVKR
jgi:hypothetical protein